MTNHTGPVDEAHLSADRRPIDPTPVHTEELPATPTRDRNIPASAWIEAPRELLEAHTDLSEGTDEAHYKRRIGAWLLWRAGPARRGEARYVAVHDLDLTRHAEFRLHADGSGEGTGPDGEAHERFRSWKEALRDDD